MAEPPWCERWNWKVKPCLLLDWLLEAPAGMFCLRLAGDVLRWAACTRLVSCRLRDDGCAVCT